MKSFTLCKAKKCVGQNVNLHLKDGAVIINVQLKIVKKSNFGKTNLLEYVSYKNRCRKQIPLKHIMYAKKLDKNIICT
ncbi:MAG: hypothetical protein FWH37_06315 [Candidatus Bathyarchaeota archaeon]|nr:hypothetical protein [Candidatus Termiticorpusculum sp.]